MPGPWEKIKSLKGSVALHLALIALLGILAYSNTFDVPFQWDGIDHIVKNSSIRDLDNFTGAKVFKGPRYMGYITFALNYKLHGLDVTGYHVFNLFIHVLNALLVYLLVLLTFRTPFLTNSSINKYSKYIALFTGLLFVSHPVQTQAVTYIFQRLASLMSFFYLLSLLTYIKSRLSTKIALKYILYAFSLISAILAMKTKENAFTLPLVIMLYECFFFRGSIRLRMLRLVPLLMTMLIIPSRFIGFDRPVGEIISSIGSGGISQGGYLFTQFRVIVTYIRLLFLPVNQNIDYDYPVFHSFFNPQVLLSVLFLLSILCLGVYLLYRSRLRSEWRLLAFGLFWFFITLSVESSIIPIPMIINEYRVYLPSVGAFLAITTGAFLLLDRLKDKRIKVFAVSSFILVPLVFLYAAYARNSVWQSEISLWEDVVRTSPYNARGHNNLGKAYSAEGLTDKAIRHFQISLRLMPDNAIGHYNLGSAYKDKGSIDKAIEHFQTAIRLRPDFVLAHNSLGIVYQYIGLFDKAMEHFQLAIKLKPDYAEAYHNLGIVSGYRGLIDRAVEYYQLAIRLKPDYAEAHYNLGLVYLAKGLTDKARRELETALRINPDYHKARRFLNYIANPDKAPPLLKE